MPNNVTNLLTINAKSESRLEEVLNFIKSRDRILDFENIIPVPKELNKIIEYGHLRAEIFLVLKEQKKYDVLQNFKKYILEHNENFSLNTLRAVKKMFNDLCLPKEGEITDKENALLAIECFEKYGYIGWYDFRINQWGTKWNAYNVEKSDKNSIIFDTAWTTPYPVIKKLSEKFPDVEFYVKFADEDAFGGNNGEYAFGNENNGKIRYITEESNKKEFVELFEELKGYNPCEEYEEDEESKND